MSCHQKCTIPDTCQGGCWDLYYEESVLIEEELIALEKLAEVLASNAQDKEDRLYHLRSGEHNE